MTLNNGRLVMLTRVRYIPELKRNLISLGTLDESGCCYKAENGCLNVYRNNSIVLKGIKRNGLYILYGQHYTENPNIALVSTKPNVTEKWHLRMGHMSQRGMNILWEQGLFGKDNITSLDFCENCVLGKQHRVNFTKGTHLATNCLEYLHADLWGPEKIKSHGGNSYFLSIVDDYSRKVWVYLLKTKDEALVKFKS